MTTVVGKLFWLVAAPGNFLLWLLILGTLLLLVTRRRRGLGLVAVGTVGFLFIALLPVGQWLLLPLESRFPVPANLPERPDGIIVLGGAIDGVVSTARDRVSFNGAGTRMTDAVPLLRRYPSVRVLLTGGSGYLIADSTPEAEIMKTYFVSEGIDPSRMILETRSRTTYENAVLSRAVVQPKPGETWLLITSAAHMPRAVGCFRAAGWHVVPYPVDYRTTGQVSLASELSLARELAVVNAAAQEWVGLLAYYVMGHTDALFPG
jgi:uncharacterized SAM-binding protein YcdF (DUF218 family)